MIRLCFLLSLVSTAFGCSGAPNQNIAITIYGFQEIPLELAVMNKASADFPAISRNKNKVKEFLTDYLKPMIQEALKTATGFQPKNESFSVTNVENFMKCADIKPTTDAASYKTPATKSPFSCLGDKQTKTVAGYCNSADNCKAQKGIFLQIPVEHSSVKTTINVPNTHVVPWVSLTYYTKFAKFETELRDLVRKKFKMTQLNMKVRFNK